MKTTFLTLLLATTPALADSLDDFPASATITVTSRDGLHRVQVPFEAHRAARPDLADLRMFNAAGDALPFAFAGSPAAAAPTTQSTALPLFPVRATPRTTTTTTTGDVSLDVRADANGTLISLRSVPGKGAAKPEPRPAAWVADASVTTEPVSAAIIEWTPGAGSEISRVTLESSDDLKTWQPLASGSVLALEQGGQRLSQPRIEFAPRKVKYLRVTSATDGFVLTGLRVERTVAAAGPALLTVVVGGQRGDIPGDYFYDLQAAVPVSRVNVLVAEANAVAPAEIAVRGADPKDWRTVTRATFYRMTRDGAEARSAAVPVGPVTGRYWRVRIDPKAGLPKDAPRLEAGYVPREIVFASRGDGPYLLAFGNDQAKPANLPLTTLIPGYERDAEYKLPIATVGAIGMHGPAPGFSASRFIKGEGGRKTLLWIVLLGGVALLGFMAWRLNKKVG